jgi:CRISPR-associated endonuclease/helicase Cas3
MTADALPTQWQKVGNYAGLWHDLGKYRKRWQNYLRGEGDRTPHSAHGAWLALELGNPDTIPVIAWVIAAHHSGLHTPAYMESRGLQENAKGWQVARDNALAEIPDLLCTQLPDIELPVLRREFAIRMLLSALVDSDRFDAFQFESSEDQLSPGKGIQSSLKIDLPNRIASTSQSVVDEIRQTFLDQCIAAAQSERQIFRLTGACGIGKTISSAQFATIHAKHNQMKGIIYVGPLKSIIEQTAAVYCSLFGRAQVLEHHSGFEPPPQDRATYRLDTERWDKPVIVTSGVQFYESLFASTPGKCRKLKGLCDRVILIDEAQTIPLHLAYPVLDVLQTLVEDWGCSVVLMSATQPAFDRMNVPDLKPLDIISSDDIKQQFTALERVTYRIDLNAPWSPSTIAQELHQSNLNQGLIVVNTTELSRQIYQGLSRQLGHWFHLSGRMCPAHRAEVLTEVRSRLAKNKPCYLVSTQVIEAGVDVDFPRVYRQLAPLDSIIQTAGRCNRNGKYEKHSAIVQIFLLAGKTSPDANYRNRISITRNLLQRDPEALGKNMLETIERYFQLLYNEQHAGGQEIQQLRSQYNYPEVAKRFKVIDNDWQESVVVPWKEGASLIAQLQEKEYLSRANWRELQPYTVGITKKLGEQYSKEFPNGMKVWFGSYSDQFGCFEAV